MEGTEKVLLKEGGRKFSFSTPFLYLKLSKERHKDA